MIDPTLPPKQVSDSDEQSLQNYYVDDMGEYRFPTSSTIGIDAGKSAQTTPCPTHQDCFIMPNGQHIPRGAFHGPGGILDTQDGALAPGAPSPTLASDEQIRKQMATIIYRAVETGQSGWPARKEIEVVEQLHALLTAYGAERYQSGQRERDEWLETRTIMPPLEEPVLARLEWDSGKYTYAVLKHVQEGDCEWRVFDDNAELSYGPTVTHWKPIAHLDQVAAEAGEQERRHEYNSTLREWLHSVLH